MPALRVRRYGAGDAADWNALVVRSRTPHFLFDRGYMEYHRDRFEDCSLMVFDGERFVAGLPANREGRVVISHGGLTFGGLITDPSLGARRTLVAFTAILDFLASLGVRELVYKPVPHIYHEIPAEEDLYALFRHDAQLVRRDLSATLRPAHRSRMSKGRRAAVARAQRLGVTVEASVAFSEFMTIETHALEARHDTRPTHTPTEMAVLARRFPDQISLVGGFYEGRLIAGVVVYETEVVAHAQYIGACEEGYELHALDAVMEHLLTDRFREKRFFDFGISTIDAGRVLNEGLVRNKESFGGRGTAYDTYQLRIG
jgi:Acetyltransferase (GNAT) domain